MEWIELSVPAAFIPFQMSYVFLFLLETHCSRYHRCTRAIDAFFTQLAYGSILPKTMVIWARGASKNLGPLISATIEAIDLNLVH